MDKIHVSGSSKKKRSVPSRLFNYLTLFVSDMLTGTILLRKEWSDAPTRPTNRLWRKLNNRKLTETLCVHLFNYFFSFWQKGKSRFLLASWHIQFKPICYLYFLKWRNYCDKQWSNLQKLFPWIWGIFLTKMYGEFTRNYKMYF